MEDKVIDNESHGTLFICAIRPLRRKFTGKGGPQHTDPHCGMPEYGKPHDEGAMVIQPP